MSCTKEPLVIVTDSEFPDFKEQLQSPCTYMDSINVNDIRGCNGKVNIELRRYDNYQEIRATWPSSPAVFVITYNHKYGFSMIRENTQYQLDTLNDLKVDLYENNFLNKQYFGVKGSVFITRFPNGKLRADWCHIELKDKKSSYIASSFGGFDFP